MKKIANISYKSKMLFWTILFYVVVLLPTFIPYYADFSSSYQRTFAMLNYWGIILAIYGAIIIAEFKFLDVDFWTWIKGLSLFTVFAFMLSLGSLALFSISFLHFGYLEAIGWGLLVPLNMLIALVMTVVFAYTVKILWLMMTNKEAYRGHEISIRLAFNTIFSNWIAKENKEGDVILITKKSTYILRYLDTKRYKSITFEHQKELPKQQQSEHVRDIILEEQKYIIVKDDPLVSEYKNKMQTLESVAKNKTFVSTIFVYDLNLPSIHGKNPRIAFSTVSNLPGMLKNAENQLTVKLKDRKKLSKELLKQEWSQQQYL